jgi:hypothetical protein
MTYFSALLLLFAHFSFGQKNLQFENAVYEENIRTVILAPPGNLARNVQLPPVVSIHQQNLILAFDDIQESRNNYYVRFIHCNSTWQKSNLNDLDFLAVFNEFNINEYDFSSNTHLPYVHYRFAVPPVKLPGNYLLVVYRDGNKSDIILSMRFMVFQQRVSVTMDNLISGSLALTSTNQQLNFFVNYKDLEVFNPMDNFQVVIRQNQRWDNARFDVKPSFIRDDIHQLEYRFFDPSQQWMAGNEFRFVDFRSLNSPGQNTARINRNVEPYELSVQQDKTREGLAYAQYRDMNGAYVIENYDFRNSLPVISSQYLFVDFALKSAELADAKVYVCGHFNNFARTDENRMKYDKASSTYRASLVLKQGWYDYQYVVDSPTLPSTYFEGSHFQTENFYEILVYYKSLKPMTDVLVGYYQVPVNPR